MRCPRNIIVPAILALVIAVPGSMRALAAPRRAAEIRRQISEGMNERAIELERARKMGLILREDLPGGGIIELMTLSTSVPTYFITFNEDAARSTRTDSVHSVYGGAPGFTLGLWDGGAARVTHQELAGRAVWRDSRIYSTHAHSTHVGATMIGAGVSPGAKGMSYEADLISYEWSFDDLEAELEAGDGLLISNHSYGHARGWVSLTSGGLYWYGNVSISETEDYLFGFYSDVSKTWDEVANRNPYYLPVTSAGNDRNDHVTPGTSHYFWDPRLGAWVTSTAVRDNDGGETGYDCIPDGLSTAKNTLVVGAATDVPEYDGPEDVGMTEFSSWGPTDDGRIKPDICGNGYQLYSATDYTDNSYGTYSGTSMASPNVSGSLGLLQARYAQLHGDSMLASTLKALAIHTAREAGPWPGPDYAYGWGLLDTWAAFEHIEADPDGRAGTIAEMTLVDGKQIELYYVPVEGAGRMTVTVAWNDPASDIPEPALNDRTPLLVNDIDLRVAGPRAEHSPWILEPSDPAAAAGRGDNFRDNVEQVVIDDPGPGEYVVRLSHKGSLRNGSQKVSIIVSGAERTRTWLVFADGSGTAPTIKEAVERAAPGDQVFVFPGTYNEYGIVLDKPLLVKGVEGAGETVIDARGAGRIFEIVEDGSLQPDGAAWTGSGTGIDGFTLTGGRAAGAGPDGRGGALLADNVSINLSSCVLAGNEAGEGGAVYLRESRSSITDCVFSANRAGSGGGAFLLRSDAALERNIFAGNSASRGGAIYTDTSSPLIERCTMSGNGTGRGSGIYMSGGGRPRLYASIVSFSAGSGIFVDGASAMPALACCDVYGNEGGDYAGSILDQTGTRGNISEDPLFCEAEGMVFTLGDGSPCLPGRNTCALLIGARGAGCHTLTKIRVTPDGTGDAGTILEAMEAAVAGDTIMLAPGTYTGPGNRDILSRGFPLLITSEAGAVETVMDVGGDGDAWYGFYFGGGEDTTTVLEGMTIKGAGKGAVACFDRSGPLIRDCVFTENSFIGGWHGGGIVIEDGSSPVIRRCAVTGNSGNPNGGGIFLRRSSAIIEDCTITGNTAQSFGGGIASYPGSSSMIRRCIIEDNVSVGDSGGGVYLISGSMTVEDCFVAGNTAGYGGGGFFSGSGGVIELARTVIADNSSTSIGGGIYSASGMTMSRCTVTGNWTGYYGAGVEVLQGQDNRIENSIIAFNRNAGGVFTIMGDIDIACSDVYGNEGGDYGGSTADMTGPLNISEDPLFCDAGAGDYHLADGSPALSPPDPSCGDVMGALGVRCGDSADLLFSSIVFDTTEAEVGGTILAGAVVRNAGPAGAGSFMVGFYFDRADPPLQGEDGDLSAAVDTLAPGDSTAVVFDITSAVAGTWNSYLMIDPAGSVPEYNPDNNTAGPYFLTWTVPGGVLPGSSAVRRIVPNPFNRETEIVYDLDRRAPHSLVIYDIGGRRLRTWKMPAAGPGRFTLVWDGMTNRGDDLPPGVYFLRFTVDGAVDQSVKIVRIK